MLCADCELKVRFGSKQTFRNYFGTAAGLRMRLGARFARRARPLKGTRDDDVVCSAAGYPGSCSRLNHCYRLIVMTGSNNNGLLLGPSDPNVIDVRSRAE